MRSFFRAFPVQSVKPVSLGIPKTPTEFHSKAQDKPHEGRSNVGLRDGSGTPTGFNSKAQGKLREARVTLGSKSNHVRTPTGFNSKAQGKLREARVTLGSKSKHVRTPTGFNSKAQGKPHEGRSNVVLGDGSGTPTGFNSKAQGKLREARVTLGSKSKHVRTSTGFNSWFLQAATWLILLMAVMVPSSLKAADITLLSPSGMETVFGTVEVKADLYIDEGETVSEVVLWVDGKARGRLTQPPWQWQVDVGDENREHTFRVVAKVSNQETSGQEISEKQVESKVETPAIRVDEEVAVELQQLYVTVTQGADGPRVLDLEKGDFRILDQKKRQDMVTFARGDVSLTAVLLLDSSESMRGDRLRAALQGAHAFVDGMKGNDEAMVMLFSDQILRSTPFTQDGEVLHRSLDGARASGNTAVNDHLYLGLKLLDERQGRRVVVLFTDGADLHSVLDMEEVLWKARRSQALVYWLRLDDGGNRYRSFSTSWRDADGNRTELENLEKTVRQSGGRITELKSVDEVKGAFEDILAELREQYVLGYYPSKINNDGSWHEVEVQIPGRRSLNVRARDGYVDF